MAGSNALLAKFLDFMAQQAPTYDRPLKPLQFGGVQAALGLAQRLYALDLGAREVIPTTIETIDKDLGVLKAIIDDIKTHSRRHAVKKLEALQPQTVLDSCKTGPSRHDPVIIRSPNCPNPDQGSWTPLFEDADWLTLISPDDKSVRVGIKTLSGVQWAIQVRIDELAILRGAFREAVVHLACHKSDPRS